MLCRSSVGLHSVELERKEKRAQTINPLLWQTLSQKLSYQVSAYQSMLLLKNHQQLMFSRAALKPPSMLVRLRH